MKRISEYTKDDLRNYINCVEENGLDEYDHLCIWCGRCYDKDCAPEDCHPDADNADCFDAFKEMLFDSI